MMCLQVVFLAFILLRIYRNSWTLVSNFSSVLQNPHLVSFYTLLKYYLFFLSSLFLGPNSLYTRPFYNLPHISLFCFFLYLYFLFLRLSYFRPSAMYILPLGPSITFLTFLFQFCDVQFILLIGSFLLLKSSHNLKDISNYVW